jgi:hypothetical protein
MIAKNLFNLMIRLVVIVSIIPIHTLAAFIPINSAFADNLCFGLFKFTAIGARGGDTDDTIIGDIVLVDHFLQVIIQQLEMNVAGSTGSGDHSMNGGNGGEDSIN